MLRLFSLFSQTSNANLVFSGAGRQRLTIAMSFSGYNLPEPDDAVFSVPRQTERSTRDCRGFVYPGAVPQMEDSDGRGLFLTGAAGEQVNSCHRYPELGQRYGQPQCNPERYIRKRYSSCRYNSVSFS